MLDLCTLCHHSWNQAVTLRDSPEPQQRLRERIVSAVEEVMGDSGRWGGKGDPAAGMGRDKR